ncbi:MAG: LUD domain-containing protein [Pseudomonadota bacterium]
MSDARTRILEALGAREGLVGDPAPTPLGRPALPDHEIPRLLALRLRAHGTACHLTQDHAQSIEVLADQLYTAGVRNVVVANDGILDGLNLAARLAASLTGVRIHRPGDLHDVAAWERMEVGITACASLWAETGTMVLDAASRDGLKVSLLPRWHVLLGDDAQLFRDAQAWVLSLDEAARSRPRVTLQGPSRTADIEKRLVLGVHGPARVTAFIAVGKMMDFQNLRHDDHQGGN